MTKRSIRLKEWGLNLDTVKEINDRYLAGCDGSIMLNKVRLRTDNNGFIKTGNDIQGERGNIIFLGGSFVEAIFAEEKKRWPSVIERELESQSPGKYQILNGGYSGASSLHLLNLLTTKIRPFLPTASAVALCVSLTDAKIARQKHTLWAQDPYIDPMTPTSAGVDFPNEKFNITEDRVILWELMLRFLQHYDIPVIVIGSPYRRSTWDSDKYLHSQFSQKIVHKNMLNIYDRVVDETLNVARQLDVPTIDARYTGWGEAPNSQYFYDMLHLNEQGHEFFGRALMDDLLAVDI